MRALLRRLLPVALLTVAATGALAAQTDKGIYCSVHGFVRSCDGPSACNAAWSEHIRQYHSGDDADAYWDRVVPANLSPRGTPVNVAVRGALLYGFIGALAGSLVEGPDSTSYRAVDGALTSVGLFYLAGNVMNRGGWGPLAGTFMGVAAGTTLGMGIGKFQENALDGTPEREREREKTDEMAAVGMVVGMAVGLTLPLVSRSSRVSMPGPRVFGELEPISSPTRLGVRWYWNARAR